MTIDQCDSYIAELEASITATNVGLVCARSQDEKGFLVNQLSAQQENLEALYRYREWLAARAATAWARGRWSA